MEALRQVIEEVGPYAGLLALFAVALLALLYFSQGRDVRRLRDWAGRAPERALGAVQSYDPVTAERLRAKRARFRMPGFLNQPRYLAVAVAGAVVLGGGVAYAVLQIRGGDDSSKASKAAKKSRSDQVSAVQPSQVTVAVLNGTGTPGLAAAVGSSLRAAGFKVGNVTNASETGVTDTKILYRKKAKASARAVAQQLKIKRSRIDLMDSANGALAGSAKVAVITGQDRANQAPKSTTQTGVPQATQAAPTTQVPPSG